MLALGPVSDNVPIISGAGSDGRGSAQSLAMEVAAITASVYELADAGAVVL